MQSVKKRLTGVIITAAVLFAAGSGIHPLSAGALDDPAPAVKYDPGVHDRYGVYLVEKEQYRSGGDFFHEKYSSSLLCLASALVEGQDITIIKGTMGFCRDRLAGSRTPFYLGFDVSVEYDGSIDYGRFCTRLIRENAAGIAEEALKYNSPLEEEEVAGVVVTFRWDNNGNEGHVTIWMKKGDMRLFNDGKITASEFYQRSTVTNTSGRVILLPI